MEQDPDDGAVVRSNVYTTLESLKQQLGAEQFARFESFGRQWAVRVMMLSGSAG